MGIKVQAVRRGYYGDHRREEGDVFEIENMNDFSDANRDKRPGWMVMLDKTGKAGKPKAPSVSTPVTPAGQAPQEEESADEKETPL